MQGYQVTFFTQQDRRHGHQLLHEWLMNLAKSLGIRGSTAIVGAEGYGRHGRFHSAHFFELTDQPIEVVMVMNADQADRLFAQLEAEQVNLFYVKTLVEFGVVGGG